MNDYSGISHTVQVTVLKFIPELNEVFFRLEAVEFLWFCHIIRKKSSHFTDTLRMYAKVFTYQKIQKSQLLFLRYFESLRTYIVRSELSI